MVFFCWEHSERYVNLTQKGKTGATYSPLAFKPTIDRAARSNGVDTIALPNTILVNQRSEVVAISTPLGADSLGRFGSDE